MVVGITCMFFPMVQHIANVSEVSTFFLFKMVSKSPSVQGIVPVKHDLSWLPKEVLAMSPLELVSVKAPIL